MNYYYFYFQIDSEVLGRYSFGVLLDPVKLPKQTDHNSVEQHRNLLREEGQALCSDLGNMTEQFSLQP